MTTIALGIPTTPWVPARVQSMGRLRAELLLSSATSGISNVKADHYREFADRAPNWVWSLDLWNWLHETGAEWCMQLQDDVMAAPCFWPALRAMLSSLPKEAEIVGLSAVHPMAPEWARRGHRWYRTKALLVGWAYVIRRDALGEFLRVRERLVEKHGKKCEDVLLGQFAAESEKYIWHPCPTIVDHDTSIPSSYDNDEHSTRRPQVTWRDFGEGSMTDPTWWRPSGLPALLPMPPQRVCWMCMQKGIVAQAPNGVGVCGVCIGAMIGSNLQGGRP